MKKYYVALALTFMLIFCNSTLKSQVIDYSLVCVDSVWYDPGNPQFINVTIFNGNVDHLNYPSVQIVTPTGDTIGNPSNWVNFFAQLGNTHQTYSDTITIPGITDFSNYTFLISEGFGDTTVAINWCNVTSVSGIRSSDFSMYPNPASGTLYMKLPELNNEYTLIVLNMQGEKIVYKELPIEKIYALDISAWAKGLYLIMISDRKTIYPVKFLKQ